MTCRKTSDHTAPEDFSSIQAFAIRNISRLRHKRRAQSCSFFGSSINGIVLNNKTRMLNLATIKLHLVRSLTCVKKLERLQKFLTVAHPRSVRQVTGCAQKSMSLLAYLSMSDRVIRKYPGSWSVMLFQRGLAISRLPGVNYQYARIYMIKIMISGCRKAGVECEKQVKKRHTSKKFRFILPIDIQTG